jgi:hypothetical protein
MITSHLSQKFVQYIFLSVMPSYLFLVRFVILLIQIAIIMEQSLWQRSLTYYAHNLTRLEEQLMSRLNRFGPFNSVFNELFKTIDKFAAGIITVSDSIDKDILGARTC